MHKPKKRNVTLVIMHLLQILFRNCTHTSDTIPIQDIISQVDLHQKVSLTSTGMSLPLWSSVVDGEKHHLNIILCDLCDNIFVADMILKVHTHTSDGDYLSRSLESWSVFSMWT